MRPRLAAVSAATLLCLAGATGAAEAAPASLYAPSAVVLTITQGDDAGTGTVLRATVLSCAYTAEGTHPDPRAACDALNATDGELNRLVATQTPDGAARCTTTPSPSRPTASGAAAASRGSTRSPTGARCPRA